jgi:hypothetical protein
MTAAVRELIELGGHPADNAARCVVLWPEH